MRLLRLAVLASLCVLSVCGPASAALSLETGTGNSSNPSTLSPNNYGFSGGGVLSPGEVAVLYVFNAGGTIATYADSTVGPYDGSEDTQVGVTNNTGQLLTSFTIKGTAGSGIFGFDGDGIDIYGAPSNTSDTTGYGGPLVFFTNFSTGDTGTVNFINGGLASGASTFFSVEEPPSALVGSTPISGVPEPASIVGTLTGLTVVLGASFLSRRKAKVVA